MTSRDSDEEPAERRDPSSPARDDENTDDSAERVADALADSANDDVIPASAGRRKLTSALALLIMAVILTFLVMFIITQTDQSDGAGLGHHHAAMASDPLA